MCCTFDTTIYDIIYFMSLFIFRQEIFSHRQTIKIKPVEFSKSTTYLKGFIRITNLFAWIIISISKIQSYLPCCLFRVRFSGKIRKLDQDMERENLCSYKLMTRQRQQVPSDTDMLTMLHTMSE